MFETTDSIWILLSYMKWHLSLMRTAIREAVLAAAGVPPNPGELLIDENAGGEPQG